MPSSSLVLSLTPGSQLQRVADGRPTSLYPILKSPSHSAHGEIKVQMLSPFSSILLPLPSWRNKIHPPNGAGPQKVAHFKKFCWQGGSPFAVLPLCFLQSSLVVTVNIFPLPPPSRFLFQEIPDPSSLPPHNTLEDLPLYFRTGLCFESVGMARFVMGWELPAPVQSEEAA